MKEKIVTFLLLVALSYLPALALVAASGFYVQKGYNDIEFLCAGGKAVSKIKIPRNLTQHGFPFPWLTIEEGEEQFGCGPVVGYFVEPRFSPKGFASDLAIYYPLCFLMVLHAYWNRKKDWTAYRKLSHFFSW